MIFDNTRRGINTALAGAIIVIIIVAAVAVIYVSFPGSGGKTTTHLTETINIGILEPFTGFASLWGQTIYQAAELAAGEINAQGGVNGALVRIFTADEGNGGSQTITAYNQLVLGDNATFIIGCYSSGDITTLLPSIDRYHTIVMSTTASLLSTFAPVQSNYSLYKWVFRDYVNDSETGINAIHFLANVTNTKSVVLAGEDYAYTHEIANLLTAAAPTFGFKVLAADYFDPSTSDYTSEVLKIASLNPGATLMVMSGSNGIDFIKQYEQNPTTSKIPLITAQGALINDPTTDASLQQSQPGVLDNILMEDWFFNQVLTNKTQPFVTNWEHSFGYAPSLEIVGLAYDAVYLFADAIQRAGTSNTASVVSALESTNYVGVMGHYKFTSLHSILIGPSGVQLPMVQFQNGTAVTIYPANIANGKYIPPS